MCGVVWYGVVWCGVVWCGVVWCGVVWCGVVWYLPPRIASPPCQRTFPQHTTHLCKHIQRSLLWEKQPIFLQYKEAQSSQPLGRLSSPLCVGAGAQRSTHARPVRRSTQTQGSVGYAGLRKVTLAGSSPLNIK